MDEKIDKLESFLYSASYRTFAKTDLDSDCDLINYMGVNWTANYQTDVWGFAHLAFEQTLGILFRKVREVFWIPNLLLQQSLGR